MKVLEAIKDAIKDLFSYSYYCDCEDKPKKIVAIEKSKEERKEVSEDALIVKIFRCRDGAQIPYYAKEGSAVMDLCACLKDDFVLLPMDRCILPTGICIGLPKGYEAEIRPRSVLSLKKGILAIQGTIDSNYRGEVGIILINLSNTTFVIANGDKLAQMIVHRVEDVRFDEV